MACQVEGTFNLLPINTRLTHLSAWSSLPFWRYPHVFYSQPYMEIWRYKFNMQHVLSTFISNKKNLVISTTILYQSYLNNMHPLSTSWIGGFFRSIGAQIYGEVMNCGWGGRVSRYHLSFRYITNELLDISDGSIHCVRISSIS